MFPCYKNRWGYLLYWCAPSGTPNSQHSLSPQKSEAVGRTVAAYATGCTRNILAFVGRSACRARSVSNGRGGEDVKSDKNFFHDDSKG
jgi:hypothetical protein